jgi:predicted lipoprotein with Yx(FWY)xxD motif
MGSTTAVGGNGDGISIQFGLEKFQRGIGGFTSEGGEDGPSECDGRCGIGHRRWLGIECTAAYGKSGRYKACWRRDGDKEIMMWMYWFYC